MKRLSALLMLALPLCAGACASPGVYPSLAKRDAELVTGATDAPLAESPPPPLLPPPAGLQATIDRLLDEAMRAHADFEAARAATGRAVSGARGTARVSEGWVSGQVALAGLESARSGAVTALSQIDELYADERIAHPEALTPSAELLGKAREQLKALVEVENGVLAGLASQLGS